MNPYLANLHHFGDLDKKDFTFDECCDDFVEHILYKNNFYLKFP